MHIVRTILWVLILAGLLVFSWANWNPGISVRIWSNLVVDTRLPAIVVLSFLAGLLPMWLYHRGVVWSLTRRIKALEGAAQQHASVQRPAGLNDAAPTPTMPAEPLRPARPSDEGSLDSLP